MRGNCGSRRRGLRAVAALLTLLALAAVAPVAGAADPTYAWSGTLTVERVQENPYMRQHIRMTGELVTPYPHPRHGNAGYSIYRPTVQTYTFRGTGGGGVDGMGNPCVSTQTLLTNGPTVNEVDLLVEWGRTTAAGTPEVPLVSIWEGSASLWLTANQTDSCIPEFNHPSADVFPSVQGALQCLTGVPSSQPGQVTAAYAPLPAREVLDGGRIRFRGTVAQSCVPPPGTPNTPGYTTDDVTLTVDLLGTPVTPPGPQSLTVGVAGGTQYGLVADGGGAIACGRTETACAATIPFGQAVRLAALPSPVGTFVGWSGCDQPLGQSCLLTMDGPRTVTARFAYDFGGFWEPPPDGLFSPDRKAEIADDGAKAATEGAVGCAGTAILIGTAGESSVIVAGTAGVATRWQAFALKVFEETIGNCAKGVVGTITNGVLLKVDPPDPQWREIALAEPMPQPRSVRCPLPRGCGALSAARTRFAAADRRVLELREALAVAANRYGNAVGADDRPAQALHEATSAATSGMLADALQRRTTAGRALAKAIRATGVRSIVIPRAVSAAALARQRAGKGIDRKAVQRLLRRHLIARAGDATAMLRAQAAKARPAAVDVLASLQRPARIAGLRKAAATLTLGDVAILLEAAHRDHAPPAASIAQPRAAAGGRAALRRRNGEGAARPRRRRRRARGHPRRGRPARRLRGAQRRRPADRGRPRVPARDLAAQSSSSRCSRRRSRSASSSSPAIACLNSRRPRPTPLPTSGSRLGPNTSMAITASRARCQGLSRPPIMGERSRAATPVATAPVGGATKLSHRTERPQPLLRLPQPRRGALLAEAVVLDAVRLQERCVGRRRRPAVEQQVGARLVGAGQQLGAQVAVRAGEQAGPVAGRSSTRARRPRGGPDAPGSGRRAPSSNRPASSRGPYRPIVIGPARTRRRHHVHGRTRPHPRSVLHPFSGVRLQLFGITQRTLEAALHGTEVRQEVIARNLANANTPGYKRADVSFQQELAQQLQFDPDGIDSSFEPTLSVDGTTAMRVDGSNVDVDREATNLAENQLMYSALMGVVTKQLQTMSQTITGAR